MTVLLKELQSLQNEILGLVQAVSATDYQQQFHPDLSPIGWHLGHCVYTESYWIKEQLLGKQIKDDPLKLLYTPELSRKQSRGSRLPAKSKLLEWSLATQAENRLLLNRLISENATYHLLKDHYLFHFLIQHYSQHIETLYMVLTEIQSQNSDMAFIPTAIQEHDQQQKVYATVKAGFYSIGSDQRHHYDNERPLQIIKLQPFKIAKLPVSNSQFLAFINSNGYLTADYWSLEGWEWRNKNKITYPHHWRSNTDGVWFGINHKGYYSLKGASPVNGLSHYEAAAYAKWAGARLPHEYEWEAAYKNNALKQTALVWEWCNNTFQPYSGFSAYPYTGYSTPYFDNKHYVLKGGSSYTKKYINHPSFRNYYNQDKRHLFSGVRLVYE